MIRYQNQSVTWNLMQLFKACAHKTCDVNHSPSSSTEVKEGRELYLYHPLCWAFMACYRVNSRVPLSLQTRVTSLKCILILSLFFVFSHQMAAGSLLLNSR
jgi:hypothetical protein